MEEFSKLVAECLEFRECFGQWVRSRLDHTFQPMDVFAEGVVRFTVNVVHHTLTEVVCHKLVGHLVNRRLVVRYGLSGCDPHTSLDKQWLSRQATDVDVRLFEHGPTTQCRSSAA